MAVRREAVRLELEDAFTRGMLQAAGATELLDQKLRGLSGSAVETDRSLQPVTRDTDRLGTSSRKAGPEIDRLSGRLAIFARIAAAIGPAVVPIGAVAVPAVTGLASALGFAVIGMGSLVAASQGVGDALGAVNKAALEPTAENLEAARKAMQLLSPEARAFVARFQELRPVLQGIRDDAAAGWFPGLIEAMNEFESIAPQVGRLFENIGEVGGNLVAEGVEAFAGPEWADFRGFIVQEAPPALDMLGRSVGNVAAGMADLWMAFAPLNQGFNSWILEASRGFAQWADGLSETEGFQEFIAYIQQNGPRVAELAGAVADALIQITEAAAPLGGPVLEALTGVARAIATLADSPIGTPLLAIISTMSAARLASDLWTRSLDRVSSSLGRVTTEGGRTQRTLTSFSRAGSALAALWAISEAADAVTDSFAKAAPEVEGLTTSLLESDMPRFADEFGGSIGDALDALDTGALEDAGIAVADFADKVPLGTEALMGLGGGGAVQAQEQVEKAAEAFESLDAALSSMDPTQAQRAFQALARSEGLSADEQAKLIDQLPKYEAALAAAGNETEDYTDNIRGASKWMSELRQRTVAARQASRDAARTGAASFRTFDKSINKARISLGEWLAQMRKQAAALRSFTHNAEVAGKKGLDRGLIRYLREAGVEGAMRMRQLANASEKEIRRANDSWRSWERASHNAVRGAADDIDTVPEKLRRINDIKTSPRIDARLDEFETKHRAALEGLDELDRKKAEPTIDLNLSEYYSSRDLLISSLNNIPDETVYVNVQRRGHADGGTIGAYARGGTVRGSRYPYGDKVPAMLAPGEEVISNRYGQADRHRQLLKAINANRFANGGTARRFVASERSMTGGNGGGVMRHVFDVRVSVAGELDAERAVARIEQRMHEVAQFHDDQIETFWTQQRGDA